MKCALFAVLAWLGVADPCTIFETCPPDQLVRIVDPTDGEWAAMEPGWTLERVGKDKWEWVRYECHVRGRGGHG